MASFTNSKLPPNVVSSGYRSGGSDCIRPASYSGFSALPCTGASSALATPSNDFKIPKMESELDFHADSDPPSLKRPKISDEPQLMQAPSLARRDISSVPLCARQSLLMRTEHQDLYQHVEVERETKERSVAFENQFNPLNEPSPLGLNLRKSPSLLDLIQRKLDSANGDQTGRLSRLGSCTLSAEKDKLKAANFPASKLRIGKWECTSEYDGDLVAKCYYAKRKLVWEVLDRKLKSKMEMQWSDISALKAVFSDDQSTILDIELSRPPLFYRESDPQPRKHTLWHSTSDFTDGQATICRHHSIQFPAGVFNRHFEKLLQCDARLKALSEQAHNIQDSCFFDNRGIQIDRQHMLHYQSVLSDHVGLQPFTMADDALLQPAAVCAVDCIQSNMSSQVFQSEHSSQVFQSEHSQHFASRPGGVDSVRSVRMDGLRSEVPLQLRDDFHCDLGSGVQARHLQGAFQLQFGAAASPSSVIDTRGLNESSCSDETEETPSMDIRSEPLNLRLSQGAQQCSTRQPTQWAPHQFHDNMMAWTRETNAGSSPMNDVSEKQALNKLSLCLLGEPITAEEEGLYCAGSGNAHSVQEMLMNNGAFYSPQLSFTNPYRDIRYRHDKNGIVHQSQLISGELLMKVRESPWNVGLEQRSYESGSSALASHGSLVDLVYLPRIASQPKFLEPAP